MTAPPATVRTALLTGAGRGIGRAVALDLARSTDLALILVSRSATSEATARACNELRAGSARAVVADVTDRGRMREALSLLEGAAGPVGLVSAAGVLGPTGPFETSDLDAWWRAMETNLLGTVGVVRALLPRLLDDGAGRVLLFAGGGAAYGYPRFSSYGTAKAALVRFTETLAMELEGRGPIVTIVAPGANETDMLAEVRKAGGTVKTTVSLEEPCRFVRRFLTEDVRGLHGRFVHVRDTWTAESALALSENHWKLRRVE